MCRGIDDLVETSYNLSVIRVSVDGMKITVTSRSSVEDSLDDMETRMKSAGRLAGFDVKNHSRYPGWKYAEVSPMRDVYLQVYRDLFGCDGKAVGIHAGLECGLLMKRVPDMDIISIGPDIKDLHSPSESLGISSLDRLYDIVCEILKRI
ncbi:MAG: M20/M25/M40 family metallo-hydrolase, partial [Clostridia bacterium]|nr:M20/M25/M40 family metallo-hydrolase [Clostridia bacterium]